MALIRRTNGGLFPSFRSTLSELLDTEKFFEKDLFQKEWVPAVNVKENKEDYEIELAAPGFKKENFEISVDNGILSISAEKKEDKTEKDDNYTRREFSYNSFSRSFALPENANEDKIAAKYNEGVLRLSVAKRADVKAKHKSVSVS